MLDDIVLLQVLQLLSLSTIASRLMCSGGLPAVVVESLMSLSDMMFNEDLEWDNRAIEAENRVAALLSSLCGCSATIKELFSPGSNSIQLLFHLVSKPAGVGSARVAQHALEVLDVVCSHRLTGMQVSHLVESKCLVSHLDILVPREVPPFTLEFRLQVLQLFARYIAATCVQSSRLLDSLIEARGFFKIQELLLWLAEGDQQDSQKQAEMTLVLGVVNQLVFTGFDSKPQSEYGVFTQSGVDEVAVRCIEAFLVLPNCIRESQHPWLHGRILDIMYDVYMRDRANATIVDRVHPLAAMLVHLPCDRCLHLSDASGEPRCLCSRGPLKDHQPSGVPAPCARPCASPGARHARHGSAGNTLTLTLTLSVLSRPVSSFPVSRGV